MPDSKLQSHQSEVEARPPKLSSWTLGGGEWSASPPAVLRLREITEVHIE